MSQMFVQIATPGPGAVVPRSFEVTGSISVQLSPRHGPLVSKSVSVQFGDGGPVVAATFPTATTWRCTGHPGANVAPGATINIRVTATGLIRFLVTPTEPDFEDVDAVANLAVQINPPPR